MKFVLDKLEGLAISSPRITLILIPGVDLVFYGGGFGH